MLPDIYNAVADICFQFERDTGITVSDHTRELAASVVSSITEDPHPAWQVDPNRLESVTKAYLSALPMMLYQIVKSERVRDRITSFDFLHWFSKSFEAMMCIIPK